MSKTTDMTQGKPFKLIITFAVPLLFGTVFQQLYNVVDSAVVGRLIGVAAFAAVGAAGFLHWMIVNTILGFVQGFGILFAQRFGAKDGEGLRKATAMSIWLSTGIGAALTIAALFAAEPVLILIDTPKEILPSTLLYLRWMFGGTLVTMAYNLAGSLLRSLGDGKTPLVAVILASVINVALDFLFVGGFKMGVDGAAAATVFSQLFAFLYCLWRLRRIPELHLEKRDFRFDRAMVRELLRLASPLAFRDAATAVGGLIVQSVINSYGMLFVAGMTGTEKYFGFMQMIAGALDGAFATFSAQNFGSGNLRRIREGMRKVCITAVVSAVASGLLFVLFGKPLLRLLVTGTPEDVNRMVEVGYSYMLAIAIFLPVLYLLYIYRCALQSLGATFVPMLSGFFELGLRIVSVLLLPVLIGEWGVYIANSLGWLGAFLLLCISYYSVFHKLWAKKQGEGKL